MSVLNRIQLAPMEELMPLILEQLDKGGEVKFSPRGRSMQPMLRQDIDSVILSACSERLKKYDLPLYRRDNGKYILHRVVKTGDTYTCIGDNQYFCEHGIRQDQIIAVVTAFYRRDREYSVNDVSYKIYCRFWHYSRFPRRVLRAIKNRILGLLKRIRNW